MGESSQNGILFIDEAYLLALFDDEDDIFPISDEKYAEVLHLQEALMSAAISNPISKTLDNDNRPAQRSALDKLEKKSSKQLQENCELTSNDSRVNFCPICMDYKPAGQMFESTNCTHPFCMDCMGTYISTRIRENISGLTCPDPNCQTRLDPTNCHGIIPKEVLERWEDALCEATILASEKFIYCPFKNCGALLVDDNGGEAAVESECPSCHRLFCAKCKVPWHGGLSCGEFKCGGSSSVKFDEMAAELAKKKKWKRCPKCKFYVEKNEGCNHITCRCRYQFCYACGDTWNGKDHDFCSAR